MDPQLEPTGERLIEEHYRGSLGGYVIFLMHAASYRLAEEYCQGKRVLDLGCGSGYGAARIAKLASQVKGVDVSEEAIAYARTHYAAPNLTFDVVAPGAPLPFPDRHFDVVLSFQVIEHVADDDGYLAEAARILADDGVLVLITPDRVHRLLPGQRPWNRWHLREYGMVDLQRLMSTSFDIQKALHMGATPNVAAVELRRYRILKWLTFPFTFPGAPEAWRRFFLDVLQYFNPPRRASGAFFEPGFGEEVIEIAPQVARPLNLVVVGSPKRDCGMNVDTFTRVPRPRLRVAGLHAGGSGYPNAANTLRLLRERLGVDVVDCGTWLPESLHLWRLAQGGVLPMAFGGLTLTIGNFWSLARALSCRSYHRSPVYVPYPAVFLLWWASWLPRSLRPRLIADGYISLWDSLVRDRKQGGNDGLTASLIKSFESRALRSADCVLVDTEGNRELYLTEFGLDPTRVRSLPLAIDQDVFLAAGSNKPNRDEVLTVLFVGTMIPLHGIDTILDAIKRLRDLPQVRFRLIGEGQMADCVERFILSGFGERLEWIREWQHINRIAQEIADADICLGVFGGEEKAARVFPFKLYMYLAAGKAIITQDRLSLPAGVAFPPVLGVSPRSGAALANAIRTLAENGETRDRLAIMARGYFEKYLCASNLTRYWHEILAEGSRAPRSL